MDHLISWRTTGPIGALARKVITGFSSSPVLLSPVPHLFKSNTVPTESDGKLIREAISNAEDFLSRLDENPLLNPTKKEQLQLKCQKFILAHKALLSPIRQLPIELLEIIFLYVHCLEESSSWVNPPVAFVFSQVSYRWREIALSMHALWDRLPFIELGKKQTREKSYISFLSILLQRSGASPTLKIYTYAPGREIPSHPVVNLIARHSHRLLSLTIESGYTTMNSFARMRGKVPNLERLSLRLPGTPQVGRMNVFELAPLLHEVEILGQYPRDIILPWSQLTTLYDGCGVLDVLRGGNSTLKTLEIIRTGNYYVPVLPPITLPALSSLRLILDTDANEAEQLLASLTIPAIEDMKISYPGPLLTCLTSMLRRSQPPHTLRKLAFRIEYITVDQLFSLFEELPQLSELDVMFPENSGEIYRVFDRSRTPQILPELKVLMFTFYGKFDDVADIFNSISRTRCKRTTASDEHTAVGGKLACCESLRINFYSMYACLEAQRRLNRWELPSTERQKEELECLERWKNALLKELPEREFEPFPVLPIFRSPNAGEVLDELLTCIDHFDLVDIIPLRASNLHLGLSYLANMPSSFDLRDDDKYHLRQRAGDILVKWTPSILERINEYRWAIKGTRSLVYIPDDDGLPTVSGAHMDVMYGLKDELDDNDLNWSRYP